jgi:hypothetical protein
VVTCLPFDLIFAGSNPTEDDGFLRAIKKRCTTTFGEEVKLSISCREILLHIKCSHEHESDSP